MIRNKLFVIFVFFFFSNLIAQDRLCVREVSKKIKIKKYIKISKKVDETSGLIIFRGNFLTHNDSGGEPVLYKLNPKTGKVVGKIIISNAKNRDWEDITQDESYIYAGDFGNNSGSRKDLCIYKIAKKDIQHKEDIVKAEKIIFHYKEQDNYKKRSLKHNFDCEAMTIYEDKILLFTKNWKNKKTRIYTLPKEAGDYEIEAFQKCDVNGLITGASYNKKLHTLCLIGYLDYRPFMVIDYSFAGELENSQRIGIKKRRFSQTEGIFLNDEGDIFISSEKTKRFHQNIYRISLEDTQKLNHQ
jgi:hypothetical protein